MAFAGFSPKRLRQLAASLEATGHVCRPLHRELAELLDEVDHHLDHGRKATKSPDLLRIQHGPAPLPGALVRTPTQTSMPSQLAGLPGSLGHELHAMAEDLRARLRRLTAYEKKHKIDTKSLGPDAYVINNKPYPKLRPPKKTGDDNWLGKTLDAIGSVFTPENVAADTQIVAGAALAALGIGGAAAATGLDFTGAGALVGVPVAAGAAAAAGEGFSLANRGAKDLQLNRTGDAAGDGDGASDEGPGPEPSAPGSVDESPRPFSPEERRIADLLKSEGKQVKSLPESRVPGQKNPDSEVDGIVTEYKSLDAGAQWSTVRNRINDAKKQAKHVVIDARDTGLSEADARKGIGMFLKHNGMDRMSYIRVVGDGFNVEFP